MTDLITREGYEKALKELDYLKNHKRVEIINQIAVARDFGDLKENSEYHLAREEQAFVEGKIVSLEALISNAKVVDVNLVKADDVSFGATVILLDLTTEKKKTIRIVSDYESDMNAGLVSVNAPISQVLLGKKIGEEFDFNKCSYEIVDIKYF